MRLRSALTFAIAGVVAASVVLAPARALDLGGQKVTLAISVPPGGGYDLYGRLAARHLGRFLPGNPVVVPQNMPGAGSLIAANWLANVAPKDGAALAIIPSATLFENLLGNAQARFDARTFRWLASLNDYTKRGSRPRRICSRGRSWSAAVAPLPMSPSGRRCSMRSSG
jgi:tripartite-type tricarboxylate transporter receptor subunit TctC